MERIFLPGDILVPQGISMEKWSVIACDQFTSQPEYWQEVRDRVGDSPSTLNLIMPEAFLNDIPALDVAQRTAEAMDDYLNRGLFRVLKDSFVCVERQVAGGFVRRGVVGCVDLEKYDFTPGSDAPIRASERTVAERLPARMLIRRGASLELPHVIVLINDREDPVIRTLWRELKDETPIYDFDLMAGGGHIRGWQVSGPRAQTLAEQFAALPGGLKMVVGDGNHSLAAAKELWNRLRMDLTEEERENHPARFALCEAESVWDEGVIFHPIHRVIFGAEPRILLETMEKKLQVEGGRQVKIVSGGRIAGTLSVRGKSFGTMVDALQDVLEEHENDYDAMVDYVHDSAAAIAMTARDENTLAFLMPTVKKEDLFDTVLRDGVFPKKSFSIGTARDKRYYLECRKIK